MSSAGGDAEARYNAVRTRLNSGLRQIAFFVAPSAVAFLTLGDVISAALLQTGRFGPEDAVYVWAILAGSAIGLLPATLGRLYASSYFALRDTKTPLRFAIVRVILATVLGYLLSIHAVAWLGLAPIWGAAGITLAAGLAVVEALDEWTDGAALKWPNDVLRQGRKLGGILVEGASGASGLE